MDQKNGNSTAEKERYWIRVILRARGCTEGVRAYCAKRDVPLNSYYYWFRRLRVNHPEWKNLDTHPSQSDNGNCSEQQSGPETEVNEKPVRRKFSAACKAKILQEAESAPPGMVAALLRREGLYSSHLQKWRAEESRRAHEVRKRGPKTNPLAAEVKRQREEIARLEKRLTKAGHIIELQKKIAEIMEITLDEIPDDE